MSLTLTITILLLGMYTCLVVVLLLLYEFSETHEISNDHHGFSLNGLRVSLGLKDIYFSM